MSQENQELIEPYRGRLVNLMTPNEGREELKRHAASLPKNFTGIDDPHEPPLSAELVLDRVTSSEEDNAELILTYLAEQGFISSAASLSEDTD